MKIYNVEIIIRKDKTERAEIRPVLFESPECDGPEETLKSIARCRIETDLLRSADGLLPGKNYQILAVYDTGI